jgi:hypothetical protein
MKITFELTDAEVKGIKAYLKATGETDKPTNKDVKNAFDWKGFLYSNQEAVSDYIKQFELNP